MTPYEIVFLRQAFTYYRTKGLIMKNFFLALLLTLGVASAASADALTGTTCPGSGCQETRTSGKGSISIQVVGTFSGTLTFEQSNDGGTTYVTLSVTPYNSSTAVTTATAAGLWTANVAGVEKVRVRFSSHSSGTANVYIGTANASRGGGAAGLTTVAESDLSFTDVTTANATSSQHGLLKKLSGNAYDFFLGDGTYGRTVARGSTASSSPWTFSQTWTGTSGATMYGLQLNIANVDASAGSRAFVVNGGAAGTSEQAYITVAGQIAGQSGSFATALAAATHQVLNGGSLDFSNGSDYAARFKRSSTGLVASNASTGYVSLESQDVQLFPNGVAQPSCDSAHRGMLWYTSSAGGVADKMEVCAKAAADTYAWRSMATIP